MLLLPKAASPFVIYNFRFSILTSISVGSRDEETDSKYAGGIR
jgi:hypothetical protein